MGRTASCAAAVLLLTACVLSVGVRVLLRGAESRGRGSEWVGRRGAAVCGCGRCGAGQRHGAAAVDHCVVCEAGVLVRVVPGCY